MSQRNCRDRPPDGGGASRLLTSLFVLFHAWPALAEQVELRVENVSRDAASVTLSLTLPDGLPEDLLRRLDDGERVTVSYHAELYRSRKLWWNSGLGKCTVELSALFDPLTRRYQLQRTIHGEPDGGGDVGERAEAIRWLTTLEEVSIAVEGDKRPRKDVKYRVRAVLARRLVMLFVPTTVKTKWAKGTVEDVP